MSRTILVAEDERKLNRMICDYLQSAGYNTYSAYSGTEAIERLGASEADLIVLDLMLPELDGIEVARRVRSGSDVPIVMLTAKATEGDVLLGFEVGADDYVTKPFSVQELAARIRTVLRRTGGKRSSARTDRVSYGPFEVDRTRRTVTKDGTRVNLTPTQFDLLSILIAEPGRVFKRSDLIDLAGGYSYEGYERTVDTHVKNLRKAIEDDPAHPRYLRTIWRVGYKFQDAAEESADDEVGH